MACEKAASHVSEELSLSHISVDVMLREKAQNPEYRHHGIIKNCLDKRFEVPASLIVELLENEIKDVDGRSWTIVSGFPNDTEQLAEFEKKVLYPEGFIAGKETLTSFDRSKIAIMPFTWNLLLTRVEGKRLYFWRMPKIHGGLLLFTSRML